MTLSDFTAKEMIEDIKMRFEMSRTFFDIEIDWRDFLVYLYYKRYHSDAAEYLRGNKNTKYLYKVHPINKNNVLEHFCGTYIRAQKEQLGCFSRSGSSSNHGFLHKENVQLSVLSFLQRF